MSKYAPHGHRTNSVRATASTVCQKCLGTGHFIYDCKSQRPYVSRPSRTKQLKNPKLLDALKASGKPSVEVPAEFLNKAGTANRLLEAKQKEREEASTSDKEKDTKRPRKKARRSSRSNSDSDSDGSRSDSSSDSDSSSSGSSSSSSDDDHRSRKRRTAPRSRSRS